MRVRRIIYKIYNQIFEDVLTNDEMMNDIFPYELAYENTIMKVKSQYKSADKVGEVDIGCGNEFGGGDADADQGGEEPAEKVLDVAYNAGLQQIHLTKKEFMAFLKSYFGKIVKYLTDNGKADRVDTFKKGATEFTKYIVPKFDEIEIYTGKSHSTEDDDEIKGSLAISFWEDESAKGPVFYFFMDGLREVKCQISFIFLFTLSYITNLFKKSLKILHLIYHLIYFKKVFFTCEFKYILYHFIHSIINNIC